jgi:hypothetical protein
MGDPKTLILFLKEIMANFTALQILGIRNVNSHFLVNGNSPVSCSALNVV